MAVLNVTPDSFSDGGVHDDPVSVGRRLIADGADILDIGGESTRPGAEPVRIGEEMHRVLPVIATLAAEGACISVDTRNALTMRSALVDGAQIVNDVSGLTHDPNSAGVVARSGCPVVLMHMRGTPQTMASHATYDDVVSEVRAELAHRVHLAESAGIARSRIAIDPGFGFAKTPGQSLTLLRKLQAFTALGLPLVAGVSRKGFVGLYGGESKPARRAPASIAAALFALSQGASILRVHDVAETVQAVRMWHALTACDKESGEEMGAGSE